MCNARDSRYLCLLLYLKNELTDYLLIGCCHMYLVYAMSYLWRFSIFFISLYLVFQCSLRNLILQNIGYLYRNHLSQLGTCPPFVILCINISTNTTLLLNWYSSFSLYTVAACMPCGPLVASALVLGIAKTLQSMIRHDQIMCQLCELSTNVCAVLVTAYHCVSKEVSWYLCSDK